MKEPLVTISSLSKVFVKGGAPALEKIEGAIPHGEMIGVVGPDGAGKTTLLRLMAALLLPTEGRITIAGKDSVKDAEAIHQMTGYMPQKFGLYEDLTVMQNLNLYADLRSVMGEEKKETIERLLQFTNLGRFTGRLAGALSGGMKQKLGLACALIKKPTLLLLDEPSVGVDPLSRRELWKMVNGLLDEGISVVWSTAYLDEAERCHTVLLLNQGKLLYHGTPQALTARVEGRVFKTLPIVENRRHLLKELLQEENVIDASIQGNTIRLVVQDKKMPPIDRGLELVEAAPRFEDAFIDILGGSPDAESKLAALSPQVEVGEKEAVIAAGLTKKFGTFTAADQISFSAKRGEIFGLLGPNGAGKSTTFKMLCGLLRPTTGTAHINGKDLQIAPAEAREHIGYMAQRFSLYGILSVEQNLQFFSGAYNLTGKAQQEAVEKMGEIFALNPYFPISAEAIPLGFKQRLSLACATMHHPEILFLDEPTSGVDPITRREFWNHINGLVEKGVTVMVTTHFMDEAEYCDRVALINRGKILYLETPDRLKEMAKTPENPDPTLEDAFIYLIEEEN